MTIADAARATRKYFAARRAMPGGMGGFAVYDRTMKPAGIFRTEAEAQATCDRLNLLAVLDAMREPSEAMFAAARHRCAFVYNDMVADIWRAMIDAAIKEVGAHD
jgi:ribonuclease HI